VGLKWTHLKRWQDKSIHCEDIKTLLEIKLQFNLIFFIYFVPDEMVSHSGLDYQIHVCDTADVQDLGEDGHHVCYWYERALYSVFYALQNH